jgi:hypothetical protein
MVTDVQFVASQGAEQIVAPMEVVGQVAGAEPAGGSAAAMREENPLKQGGEQIGLASIAQSA